jgi:hypothetical protein
VQTIIVPPAFDARARLSARRSQVSVLIGDKVN